MLQEPFDYEDLREISEHRPRAVLRFAAGVAVAGVIVLIAVRSELGVLTGSWLIGVGAVVALAAALLRVGYGEDVYRADEARRRS
jgi:hypothetical protein